VGRTNIETVNRKIFEFTTLTLVFVVILSVMHSVPGIGLGVEFIVNSLKLTVGITDLPFALGLLAMSIGLFNFYTHFILEIGEHLTAEILSLAGMISMLCVSLLAFTSGLFSLRYVFIAFLLGINVVKNYQFSRLLASTPLQHLSSGWYKEAKRNFMLCMVPGVVFFLLFKSSHQFQVAARFR
jgi:hypothetical protein